MEIIRSFQKFSHRTAVLILLSAAGVQAFNYFYLIEQQNYSKRLDLHNQILFGGAPSPYLYRDLIPFIAHFVFLVLRKMVDPQIAFNAAYVLLDFAGISLILVSLYFYLLHWFKWEWSLIGALFCAAVIGIVSHDHYFQPWSFWEAGFVTLSLLLILYKRFVLLGLLIAIASLNRETALFIPLFFLVTTQDIKGILQRKAWLDWKNIAWFGGYLAIWALIFIGIRLIRGPSPHVETLQQILDANLDPQMAWKVVENILLFQGVFWVFAAIGYRAAPEFVRRTVWIVPLYILVLGVWSYWLEVRLLMPLYPVIIPLGICYLEEKTDGVRDP